MLWQHYMVMSQHTLVRETNDHGFYVVVTDSVAFFYTLPDLHIIPSHISG